ncbi:MAG: hypothetical protein K5857_00415 [Lachnospiraceae bacterium]|nr:hypothetical protein [Lachnospiraceae bacterium]
MKKYTPYIIFALCTLVLTIRAFYSFCWSDETFYFSTCHRFFTGDSIFLHEWFPTQLSSLILLPFYSIYMLVCGNNSGIILYFRILYVIFTLINSIVIYRILKQHIRDFLAMTCSLMVMFYAHLNIATLSYYTLSVQLFLISLILIYHYYTAYDRRLLIVAGVLFALCVLALPTLCVAYFLVLLLGFVLLASLKIRQLPDGYKTFIWSADLPALMGYTFAGICIPAVIFAVYLLCNVSVSDFVSGIPYVLTDEEHVTSLIYPIRKFFISINEVYGYFAYASYMLIILSLAVRALKKHFIPWIRTCIFLADTAVFMGLFIYSLGHTGYIQTALCLYLIPLFLMSLNPDFKIFSLFIVGGMVMSLTYSYSSNGYLYVLSMGHFIAAIGCIIAADRFLEEAYVKRAACTIAVTAVISSCLIQTMELRLVNIYRDAPVNMLNFRITDGPAKGLMTTADHYLAYNVVLSTIRNYCTSANLNDPQRFDNSMELNSNSVGNIFITKLLPWGYMCTDLRAGAPTTWRTPFNSKRLEPYYGLNPGRYPDIILVLNEEYGSYLTCGDVEADPSPNENEIGGFLLDYVNANDYEKTTVPCGTVYKRR